MNSSYTVDLGFNKMPPSLEVSLCQDSQGANPQLVNGIYNPPASYRNLVARGSATVIPDPWLIEKIRHDTVVTFRIAPEKLLISELGWTREQTVETRNRLATFEEDWDAPGMEAYDDL